MSDENTPAEPLSESVPEPVLESTESETVENPAPETSESDEPAATGKKDSKKPWYEGRLSETTAQRNEARAEAERVRKENEELRAKLAAGATGVAEEEIEKIVKSRLQKELPVLDAQREFSKKAESILEHGKEEYKDFEESLGKVNMLGDAWARASGNLVEAVSKEEAAKIIDHLAGNLDEAARITALTPAKQIAEFTRMGIKLTEPKPSKPVSDLPKPITTVSTSHANPAPKSLEKATSAAEHHKIQMEKRRAAGLYTW